MDGSDDYFTDDIVLDEQTLAVLDQEEQQYLLQNTAPQLAPPATKRQKTNHGWKPGVGNRRTTTLDELEDLPEISVQGDGSYGVRLGARNITDASENILNGASSNHPPHSRTGVNLIGSHSSAGPPPGVSRHLPQPPPPSGYQPSHSQNRSQQRLRQHSYGQAFRAIHESRIASKPSRRVSAPLSPAANSGGSGPQQFGPQVEDLRQQMEEVCLA